MAEAPSLDGLLDRLSRLKPDDREAIRTLSAQVRRTIEGIAIPDDLAAAITRALALRVLAFHNRLAPDDRLSSDNCLPSDETDGALARPPHVDNSTGTRALISAGCGLGGRFCAVTGALPQAPLAAIR
jgi:hypothetical protein